MDGCIETSQIICTCDKNILYAPIPQIIQYGRPELCTLILADPHAQNIFLHEFGNGFLEQILDVVHAVDICHLQQFTDFSLRAFSSGLRFFRDISFSSILMLLFYTSPEVYTIIGMVSLIRRVDVYRGYQINISFNFDLTPYIEGE